MGRVGRDNGTSNNDGYLDDPHNHMTMHNQKCTS